MGDEKTYGTVEIYYQAMKFPHNEELQAQIFAMRDFEVNGQLKSASRQAQAFAANHKSEVSLNIFQKHKFDPIFLKES